MSRPFVVRPEAEEDLADAFSWYEGQVAGLGDEFFRSVDAVFALIQRHPAAYPVIYQDVRRGLVRRFPYGVFYVADTERTVVLRTLRVRRGAPCREKGSLSSTTRTGAVRLVRTLRMRRGAPRLRA